MPSPKNRGVSGFDPLENLTEVSKKPASEHLKGEVSNSN